jgi:hypothetical protein
MTRKLSKTLAIIVIALAPLIGAGTAEAHGFGGGFGGGGIHGGGFGGHGFYGGYGRGFTAATGVVFMPGTAAAFTAGMVASIRATMGMAIPHTVTTATDRIQLTAGTVQLCHEAKAPPAGRGFGFQCLHFAESGIAQHGDADLY